MKIQLQKANAFEIKPDKKYLVLLTNKDNMLMPADIDDINARLNASFNNMTVVALPDGVKFRVVEAGSEQR